MSDRVLMMSKHEWVDDTEQDEPAVLGYEAFRKRERLVAWQRRQMAYALGASPGAAGGRHSHDGDPRSLWARVRQLGVTLSRGGGSVPAR